MNRYESNLKASSPVIDDIRNEFRKMPRGVHDLTSQIIFDASDGWIIPFDYYELVPNSQLYLTYDISLLSHNPTFRRLLSGASIEVRVYKRPKNDSWEHWNNFITRGRDGKDNSTIPYLNFNPVVIDEATGLTAYTCTPHSPASYLGLVPPLVFGNETRSPSFVRSTYPQRFALCEGSADLISTGLTSMPITSIGDFSSLFKVSALPFVMLEAINKEFVNWNLLQSNQQIIKANENHQDILPYSVTGGAVCSSDFDRPTAQAPSVYYASDYGYSDDVFNQKAYPILNILRRADKRGDYFDTGSPFPDLLRGDTPTLDVSGAYVDFSNAVLTGNNDYGFLLGLSGLSNKLGLFKGSASDLDLSSVNTLQSGGNNVPIGIDSSSRLLNTLNRNQLKGLNFSLNAWRQLATLTVFRERMARTDGSYNEMIEAQFGHNPRWHGHKPTFCGGFRQPIVFSEVVQQSASGDTPLGTSAGRSVSSATNRQITVSSDDYCDVMAVMVIRSEEYYNQGVDKLVSRLTQAEQYFPIMNNLNADATLNKELYLSGSSNVDNDVFNYQERFAYYKSKRNQVTGLMGLPYSSGAGSITQYVKHRVFTSTPNFNHGFMQDTEDANMKSVYTSSIESEYVIRVGKQAKLVAPIPEVTVPSDMGLSY